MVYLIKADNSVSRTLSINPEPNFTTFTADAQKKRTPTPQHITPAPFGKTPYKAPDITEIAKATAEAYKTVPGVIVADLQKQIEADLTLYTTQQSYTDMAGYYQYMGVQKSETEIAALQTIQLNKIAEMSVIVHTGYTAPIMGIRASEVEGKKAGEKSDVQINKELSDTRYNTFAKCPNEQYGLFKVSFDHVIKGEIAFAVDSNNTPETAGAVASSERASESYFSIPTFHVYTSHEANTFIDKGPEDSSEMSTYLHELLHAGHYLNNIGSSDDGLPMLEEEYYAYYHDQKFLYGNRSTTRKDLRMLAAYISLAVRAQDSISRVIKPNTKEYTILQQVIKELRAGKDITPDEFNKLFA